MKAFTIILLTLLCIMVDAQEKKALIVAIGEYQSGTRWNDIGSLNDIPLIKDVLSAQEFKEDNITVLKNEEADYEGIKAAWEKLIKESNKGDIVVIHFSTHGQQIQDLDGDEPDGFDEAIATYDAQSKMSNTYKGEKHLKDDTIRVLVKNLRKKLGKTGHLLLLVDACYSGSITRGGIARGISEPFIIDEDKLKKSSKRDAGSGLYEIDSSKNNLSKLIVISGSQANRKNYELNGLGSLSFVFNQVMQSELSKSNKLTYRQLVAEMNKRLNEYPEVPREQDIVLEGDIDITIFDGKYKKQEKYYEISTFQNDSIITINKGKLNQVFLGSTYKLLPSGTLNSKNKEALTIAEVIESQYNTSKLKLRNKLSDTNNKKFWLFEDNKTFGDIFISIFFEEDIPLEIKKPITEHLNKNAFGRVTKDSLDAKFTIAKDLESFIIYNNVGKKKIIRTINRNNPDQKVIENINRALFQIARIEYLYKVNVQNDSFKMDFRLIPVKAPFGNDLNFINQIEYVNDTAKYYVNDKLTVIPFSKENNTISDQFILEVTNHTDRRLYFNIIELSNSSKVKRFFPDESCYYHPEELIIKADSTRKFLLCGNGNPFTKVFYPPYEELRLKLFASPVPINLDDDLFRNHRGPKTPLEEFFVQSGVKNRTSGTDQGSTPNEIYTFDLDYEIVESRK